MPLIRFRAYVVDPKTNLARSSPGQFFGLRYSLRRFLNHHHTALWGFYDRRWHQYSP